MLIALMDLPGNILHKIACNIDDHSILRMREVNFIYNISSREIILQLGKSVKKIVDEFLLVFTRKTDMSFLAFNRDVSLSNSSNIKNSDFFRRWKRERL